MSNIIELLLRPIILRVWVWRIVWRSVSGRWFIFRDVPWWVVARFMNCDVPDLERQAKEEAELRLHRAIADFSARLKAAIAEAQDESTEGAKQ